MPRARTTTKSSIANPTPGIVQSLDDAVSSWQRLIFGFLGASMVSAIPLINRLTLLINGTWDQLSGVVVLAACWIASIMLTTFARSRNHHECIFMAMGLPGLFVSLSLGIQITPP